MPIFDYRCRGCGREFEALVLPNREGAECPGCASGDLEQLVSGFAPSSEATQHANLMGAHRRAAVERKDRAREQHKAEHNHFGH